MNRLYVMDLPGGTPRLLTSGRQHLRHPAPRRRIHADVVARRPVDRLRHVDDDRRTHQAGRGERRRAADADAARGLLPRSRLHAGRLAASCSSAAPPPISSTRSCSTRRPPDDEPRRAPREIGGVNPPNTLEIRSMPAAGGALDARRVRAGRTRAALRAQRQQARLPHDQPRAAVDHARRLRSPHALPRHRHRPRQQPAGARRDPAVARRHARVRQPAGPALSRHRAARRPRDGRDPHPGPRRHRAVPVKRMSLDGGDYLQWTTDGKAVTWALGRAVLPAGRSTPTEPQKTDVVVELPRARPKGSVLLTGARVITMKGDEVIASGRRPRHRQPDRRGRASRARSRRRPARARSTSAGKTIMPGLVDAHSHMWAPRGLHQTEVWQYMANLAYGVTTTRDPQTSTPDVFAYADMVDAGMMPGPRIYATGPGVFAGVRHRRSAMRRSASSSATATRTRPTRSSSTSPAIASSGSGSSRRARSTGSRRRSKARSISS